ncbi:MAG: hypothetical protein C0597_13390 [Marinilabiliales bacterium]|nr:MAG: hypothetical protein C0597_13390 [Marinilabiliales bacterium]
MKMKKQVILILGIILFNVCLFAQKNTLVLMHPTAYNLELFTSLLNKKIIDLRNITIVGVYHEKETYDYSESAQFLEENNYANITLRKVAEDIEPNKLYQENECSYIYRDIFQKSVGIIFFGGPDLPPAIYGESMSLLTRMTDPYRLYFEASFMFHLLGGSQNEASVPLLEENPSYTVYAICLGMQTMNIATGGSMVQDIPSELYDLKTVEEVLALENNKQHRNYNNNLTIVSTLFPGNFHQIKITNQKPLAGDDCKNLSPLIYSNHHQAIEKLGKNLMSIANSMDGKIIEAIVHEKYPNVLGIQFHPEGKSLHDPEIKYRKNLKDDLTSGIEILKENQSYQFHIEFWETFTGKIKSN